MQLAWVGDGAPRMEVAHVEIDGGDIVAVGTQLGAIYELRYRLDPQTLRLEVIGGQSLEVSMSEQRYEPLGNRRVRFRAGSFTSDIEFDEAGFVTCYPGIGMRVG